MRPAFVLPVVLVLVVLAALFGFAPLVQEGFDADASAALFLEESERINVNEAGISELMLLPGIGEVKAKAIVAYRQEHGSFTAAEDLLQVEGIGPKTVQDIEGLVAFA